MQLDHIIVAGEDYTFDYQIKGSDGKLVEFGGYTAASMARAADDTQLFSLTSPSGGITFVLDDQTPPKLTIVRTFISRTLTQGAFDILQAKGSSPAGLYDQRLSDTLSMRTFPVSGRMTFVRSQTR